MMAFGHAFPDCLRKSEPKPVEDKSLIRTQRNQMYSEEDKNIMMIEIKKQLQLGLKRSIDIYFAIEEIDALPKYKDEPMSEVVFRKYVTMGNKELFPHKKQIKEDIISMFKKHKKISEISSGLKTSTRYVRHVLAKQGLIEKRKTSRIYAKKAA